MPSNMHYEPIEPITLTKTDTGATAKFVVKTENIVIEAGTRLQKMRECVISFSVKAPFVAVVVAIANDLHNELVFNNGTVREAIHHVTKQHNYGNVEIEMSYHYRNLP